MQCPEFDDPALDTQPGRWKAKAEIEQKLNEILSQKETAYWLEQLEAKRIPCAPVNKLSDALSDKQVLHRNMVIDLKHPNGNQTKGPGNPIKLSRSDEESFSAAPELGEHTQQVLESLVSYSKEDIERLFQQGVIA